MGASVHPAPSYLHHSGGMKYRVRPRVNNTFETNLLNDSSILNTKALAQRYDHADYCNLQKQTGVAKQFFEIISPQSQQKC